MGLYVLKVLMLATAAGSLAWIAVWLVRIIAMLYAARDCDFDCSDMTTNELAVFIDETEVEISSLRYHCNEMEMIIIASPLIALVAVPLYKLGTYILKDWEREVDAARQELMKRMREEAAQETSNGQA